jgi:hypothetical protein
MPIKRQTVRDAKDPLSRTHPEIAAEWHPTKNGDLTPNDVTPGCNKKVWWECSKGVDHVWQATVCNRTKGRNCPFCSGRSVSVTNSLASQFPDAAAQWHATKNGETRPDQVVAGSNQQFWWQCPEGLDHEWEASPGDRTKKKPTGCPFCAGKKVSGTNTLASLFPAVAAEWHPTKNGTLAPDKVVAGSHLMVWWQCPDSPDHEWQAVLCSRTNKSNPCGCPYCAGKKVSATNSVALLFPDIAAEWHATKNGDLTSDKVVAGSAKKVWWRCPNGPDHEWQASVVNRTCGYRKCQGGRLAPTYATFVSANGQRRKFGAPSKRYH